MSAITCNGNLQAGMPARLRVSRQTGEPRALSPRSWGQLAHSRGPTHPVARLGSPLRCASTTSNVASLKLTGVCFKLLTICMFRSHIVHPTGQPLCLCIFRRLTWIFAIMSSQPSFQLFEMLGPNRITFVATLGSHWPAFIRSLHYDTHQS